MKSNYYFLVNNLDPDLVEIRIACLQQHAAATRNRNELSEVVGFSEEERLIKVADVDEEWLRSQAWTSDPRRCIWKHAQDSDRESESMRVVAAWCEAQNPESDLNEDGRPDTNEERRSWWQRIINLFN